MATKEGWPEDDRPRDTCVVCGKRKNRIRGVAKACACPWAKPFEEWPRSLLNTLQALVAGGPREP